MPIVAKTQEPHVKTHTDNQRQHQWSSTLNARVYGGDVCLSVILMGLFLHVVSIKNVSNECIYI